MFEYIKRVSVAIGFMSQKVDADMPRLKLILEDLSFDMLLMAQPFRTEEFKLDDLRKLESKICYLIDVMDFGRINNLVSSMNAKVFVDSMLVFLKHVVNLIVQKNSLSLPIYSLKELDEVISRKTGKDISQSKYFGGFSFTDVPTSQQASASNLLLTEFEQSQKFSKEVKTVTSKVNLKPEVGVDEPTRETPKKILEESLLMPVNNTSSVEREIGGRRQRILKVLTLGGASIKDISSKMTDVSEKTIQRDLLELMRDKKVIMLGKKRWAKYYLK